MVRGSQTNRGTRKVAASRRTEQSVERRAPAVLTWQDQEERLLRQVDDHLGNAARIATHKEKKTEQIDAEVARLVTERNAMIRESNLAQAEQYSLARRAHVRVEQIRKIKDGPHGWEADESEDYEDRTPAKKPCWICGQGKRAKIHE